MTLRLSRLKEWILAPGEAERTPAQFFDALAAELVREGFPLWRAATVLISNDPLASVTHLIWSRGQPTKVSRPSHPITQTPSYRGTPVEKVLLEGQTLRLRLDDDAVARFPVLKEVRAGGGTDYLVVPVSVRDALSYANTEFTGRTWISFTTDSPGGFSDGDVKELEDFARALSIRLSLETSKQTARSLLRAYVGGQAARSVLEGQFRRGTAESLRAVLWYCDMRDFTALSDRRPPLHVVRLLDRYFDAVAAPVETHGGEILKFVGDGVLGIFRLLDRDPTDVARRALLATREAITRLSELNAQLKAEGTELLQLGIGLHAGEVAYGNIGAAHRLDFTVIGGPVNEVCRVEALTRSLGESALLTREFVDIGQISNARSLGRHRLKGVSEAVEIFAFPEQ